MRNVKDAFDFMNVIKDAPLRIVSNKSYTRFTGTYFLNHCCECDDCDISTIADIHDVWFLKKHINHTPQFSGHYLRLCACHYLVYTPVAQLDRA